ncbi:MULTISPECIES: DMT family transporter [Priestia]|uniref:DMT family transporter n=1 Tax=Priestia TaxID=2800373 RepID=UPI001FD86DA7|nr:MULTISPECIES: DMT family transporter [Priestia]USL45327.1 DMT family transporter [Priestia megaterium]
MNKYMLIGTVALISSALLTSINQVLYAKWVQNMNPFVYSFLSFSLTLLFFLIITCIVSLKNKQNKDKTKENKKNEISYILILNTITAIIFICFYYANKFIEPAIVSSIEIGIGPIIALSIGLLLKNIKLLKVDVAVCIGILLGTCILVWASITGASGVNVQITNTLNGLITSFIAGIGMVLATLYSKKLSELGWTTFKILAHRFYMLVPLSFILVLNQNFDDIIQVFLNNWLLITIFTFLGLVIPLYLIQVGIKHCNPLFVAVTMSCGPVFTFLFQLIDPRVEWSWTSLSGIVIICLFVVLKVLYQKQGLKVESVEGETIKHA